MMNIRPSGKLIRIIEISIALFGLFVIYQIMRYVFGGSWNTEQIILTLVAINTGCVFTIGIIGAVMRSDINHLNRQFTSLASDYKQDREKIRDMTTEFKQQRIQLRELVHELKSKA